MIQAKPNRNDPCPCGSGKKFKKCCLAKELKSYSRSSPLNKVGDFQHELDRAKLYVNSGNIGEAMNICRSLLAQSPNNIEALNLYGILLFYSGNVGTAITILEKVIAISPKSIDAHNNLGEFYRVSGNIVGAIKHFQNVLALNPNNLNALINCGNVLQDVYQYQESVAYYQKALSLEPKHLGALSNLGNLYQELGQHEKAVSVFETLVEQNENFDWALGGLQFSKLHCCDWDNYEEAVSKIRQKIKQGLNVIKPFELLAISDSPEDQHLCAANFVKGHLSQQKASFQLNQASEKEKIRVGYFSADFHDHATMHLMAELFEHHDKNQFEWIAFSFGHDCNDRWRKRASNNFSQFIDVKFKSDADVVSMARSMELDIAIDLKGYTTNSRPQIFYQRVAPLQLSFLGYPGTMGEDFIDYLVADKTLITKKERRFYSEKIIYMPDSYQVNDSSQTCKLDRFTRKDFGLPEGAFIFCSFNNPYKITPVVFDSWMSLLTKVEGSILWLYESNSITKENLKKEAVRRGVSPDRLIFASHMDRDSHLSRIALADLFLDTLPCNAHTTASDALRVGLPVLTIEGESFAGRVASSLLRAIGVPDLVVKSVEDYELLALGLAKDSNKLGEIKSRLLQNINTYPLFDSPKYTKHFESALKQIHTKFKLGLPIEDLTI